MVKRILEAVMRALRDHGWAMVPPSSPYDLGYALPRSEWAPTLHPHDRAAAPLSPREEEIFRRITAGLAE
jgi:DNA-binding NarL/FixJ family response regulator